MKVIIVGGVAGGASCAADLPWNINIPDFVEVDLEMLRLATTRASGENRTTPIEHLSRHDGTIVLHGFEKGRAFSFVIDEAQKHYDKAMELLDAGMDLLP